ncbi:conserved hypothetical protein [Ricinus communis]|uniref:Uncharacterized protein n=1 Tax=Ricinus communis TaxID=3988 RepID=B9TML5_RICCO|nr:conserved hypothetical protein [Ricinus communis]
MNALLALGTGFVVAALVHYASTLIALRKERSRARHQADRLAAYELASQELERALWTWRDVFDHFGAYVKTDPKLDRLLFVLSQKLPGYARELPKLLLPLPASLVDRDNVRAFSYEFEDGRELDQLVKDINDPVFNALWSVRSPAAVAEMFRHGLFLALGYPHAVAAWRPDGVNLELSPFKEPGYPNWGLRPVEALPRSFDGLWKKWRALKPHSR